MAADLSHDEEDCKYAAVWLKLYRRIVEEHSNKFLSEAFDIAWAQVQMSRERILEEQRAIWRD